MKHILEADSIIYEIGIRKILSDIYIKCETGKITAVLGRNGQGKTCLMNTIYGVSNAQSKSIRFDNVSIVNPYRHPKKLLYLTQKRFIPTSLTGKQIFSNFEISYSEFEKSFPEFIHAYNMPISQLSGGQKRLLEIYVIIRSTSQFAMLDEPFSNLSPIEIQKVKDLLQDEKKNKGFLITDHMYNEVLDISDYTYILVNGKTNLVSTTQDIEKYGYAILRR